MSSDGEGDDFLYEDDDGFGDDGVVDEDDSMSELEDEDAYAILSPSIELPQKKPYDVDYRVRTMQEIIDMQRKQVDRIRPLLNVSESTASTLLRHYNWNAEKLQEEYFMEPAVALQAAGLSPPSSPSSSASTLPPLQSPRSGPSRSRPSPTKRAQSGRSLLRSQTASASTTEAFECPICCTDFPASSLSNTTFAMSCGHRFCRDCWREYLVGKIAGDGEASRIQCMGEKCGRIVREEMVVALVPGEVVKKYHRLLNAAYVADSNNMRWCPHRECEYIIECNQAPPRLLNQIVPTVTCKDGQELCFGCGHESSHRPVLCRIVKLWEKKCADDSETANWLSANTKECTKCHSTIEKNGGCNHMTCKKCKWEFCWVCMGPWSEHGTAWYQCNRFDEKSGSEARDAQAKSRASLERYLHYFNRWANHEQSAKLDVQFYKDTERRMEAMQSGGNLSWIEVQFAKQAVDAVINARHTLKWSYCMAFYLKRNNMTELFEDNQRDLERAVENLGYLLEQNPDVQEITKLKHDITNQSAYVQKRHDILLDDTLKGHLEGRWEFSDDRS